MFFVGRRGAANPNVQNLIVFIKHRLFFNVFDCFFARAVFGRNRDVKNRLFLVGGPAPQNRMSKTGLFLKWSAQPPTLHRQSDIVFGGVSARPDIRMIGVVRPAADE